MMKLNKVRLNSAFLKILVVFMGTVTAIQAHTDSTALVVTASNGASNQLLVYNIGGELIQTVPTHGAGGVGGNAGGIAAKGDIVAVVNFGSQSVSILRRQNKGFDVRQIISTVSRPVSLAFGHGHLYVLGTTEVESHTLDGSRVNQNPDGVVNLLVADGSAAQVGVLNNELVISEKSNVIETVTLLSHGAVNGPATLVQNIPANVDTPFGLVTHGDNAYVTIAHANEISLVRDGAVLTVTGSGTQNSPCWLTLVGPFLYSSNSPSKSVSRYAVYGQKIVQDAAIAAQFAGSPTDIASGGEFVAVLDGAGQVSHLSIFSVDEDGNLTLLQPAASINGPANGVAVLSSEDGHQERFE